MFTHTISNHSLQWHEKDPDLTGDVLECKKAQQNLVWRSWEGWNVVVGERSLLQTTLDASPIGKSSHCGQLCETSVSWL